MREGVYVLYPCPGLMGGEGGVRARQAWAYRGEEPMEGCPGLTLLDMASPQRGPPGPIPHPASTVGLDLPLRGLPRPPVVETILEERHICLKEGKPGGL